MGQLGRGATRFAISYPRRQSPRRAARPLCCLGRGCAGAGEVRPAPSDHQQFRRRSGRHHLAADHRPLAGRDPARASLMADKPNYFDPLTLSKLSTLLLRARYVVEGLISGLHTSPYKGFSVEFSEHRQYAPGDEIRHIDWKAYGKFDRY